MNPESIPTWIRVSQVVGAGGAVVAIALAVVSKVADLPQAMEWSEWALYVGAAGVVSLLYFRTRQRKGG